MPRNSSAEVIRIVQGIPYHSDDPPFVCKSRTCSACKVSKFPRVQRKCGWLLDIATRLRKIALPGGYDIFLCG